MSGTWESSARTAVHIIRVPLCVQSTLACQAIQPYRFPCGGDNECYGDWNFQEAAIVVKMQE